MKAFLKAVLSSMQDAMELRAEIYIKTRGWE
jgi:hypothetical protein